MKKPGIQLFLSNFVEKKRKMKQERKKGGAKNLF